MTQLEGSDGREEEFLELIRETFEPHTKSKQWFDHPDVDAPSTLSRRHNDGQNIYQRFGLKPIAKFFERASRENHAIANHPSALPHFVTHLTPEEKRKLASENPHFDDLPRARQLLFDWYRGLDEPEGEARDNARDTRIRRLRPGGTGMILHGEQGTTKTTAMYWLVASLMQVNQEENVIWQATLDDTEWQVFAPWATICLPQDVDVSVSASPIGEFSDLGVVDIDPEDICRQVIRYSDPEDLFSRLSKRTPGQFYVVYPDPHFRKCEALTTWAYDSIWEVESTSEVTNLNHFWFGLMKALSRSEDYTAWTTLVADEAHKWLRQGKGNDEHDWWNKIDDWATYWGDARKKRLSCLLSVHKWGELHVKVRKKVRWAATMNGEKFPDDSPVNGWNRFDQGLGDTCIWNNQEWNHVGYPDVKRKVSPPAVINVSYPEYSDEKVSRS